ncbi:MAG TPA: tRNA (adenosine(37)-N6)-dimethylallyltransferase MiaA [Dissulfurispiraceae bacterium]
MEKVIVLLGPTGVGKTAASLLLAKTLDTEIVSADSMQIYRHMDIGTAKPSDEERRQIKHHMIDVVEPWEAFSTGEYIKQVRPALDALLGRGKGPLIVGGTGLYVKAMTRGIFTGPSADWELRSDLLREEEASPGFLYERLKSLDASAAAKIMPADTRRIVRALEVCMKSSNTISALHKTLTNPLPYEFFKIGLARERNELYRMIDQRVDAMVKQGLVEEVKRVLGLIAASAPPGLRAAELSSMQAIGYKEIAAYLAGETGLEDALALVKQRSRNYAKRQFTWFRKEEGIRWVDVTGMHDPSGIFGKIKELLPV